MKVQKNGSRVTVEKTYVRPDDRSDLALKLPDISRSLTLSRSGWTGVFASFSNITYSFKLPDLIVDAFREKQKLKAVGTLVDTATGRSQELDFDLSLFASEIAFIDSINSEFISGWAWSPANTESIAVEISDGAFSRTALANRYRPDLDTLGIGAGLHGFQIASQGLNIKKRLAVLYQSRPIGYSIV